jgi:membrane protein YqaA with SNARE-associated domain
MALVLAEADEGGFPEWLNKVLNLAKDWIKNEVTAAIGAVIGALVGWLLGKVINFFAAVRKDDIFTSVTVSEQMGTG